MARTTPRPRRQVNSRFIRGLTPVVRYSPGREAYVLRGVGGRFGPVLVPKVPPTDETQRHVTR